MITVELEVAARNGKPKRLIVATAGGTYHRDEVNTDQAAARRRFISDLAAKLNVNTAELSHVDNLLVAEADQADQRADEAAEAMAATIYTEPEDVEPEPEPDERERLLAAMPEHVKAGALRMLEAPDLLARIMGDITNMGVAGERELAATLYLVGTSRLLRKPLAAIVQGQSASGKSYNIERVAKLFPPEAVITATQMTPQALFHMPPGSLEHRFIVAGERSRMENDERAEATRALREMISAGRLEKLMPVKSEGQITTLKIVQEGPIAFVESTTLAKVFDEDANRCLMLTTDERREQTKRIITSLARGYAGGQPDARSQEIIERHHALQRLLLPYNVVVPWADKLAERIATEKVETRRAFPQLISAVQASALLHQRQRQFDEDGRLIADREDYQLARGLLLKPLGRLLGGRLSDPAARFAERLATWATGQFTTRDAGKHESATDRAIRGWLVELHDAGRVELIDPPKGPKPATWIMATDAAPPDPAELPSVSELFA